MDAKNLTKDTKRRFENEPLRAQQLVTDSPKHWECLLAIELLRSKVPPISKKFDDLRNGQAFKRSRQVSEKEVVRCLRESYPSLYTVAGFAQSPAQVVPHFQS
jgi:hypothetical protein